MIKNRVALVVVAGLALAGCDRDDDRAGELQGVVELDERYLSFEVPGRVTAVSVQRGDTVKPGDVLATIDDTIVRTSVAGRQAEAAAAKSRAELVDAGGRIEDIRAVEAQLRAARASEQLAATNLERDRQLLAKRAVTGAAVDESETRVKTTTAERQALEQRLRELKTGARKEEVANARAQATAAEAAARLEAQRADHYQLRPIHAGEVLDVHVDPGEVVGAGTPVVTVADTTHPYVDVFVPQQEIAGLRVGTPANVRTDAVTRPLRGAIEDVARQTEFTPRYLFSERERANLVIRVRVRIADPERQLHAGVPAFVTFERLGSPAGAR